MNRELRRARERHKMPGPFDWAKPEVIEKFCATTRNVRLRKRLQRMLKAFFESEGGDQTAARAPRKRSPR